MSVVGLDLGNANAVMASAGRGGVDVVLNGNSNRLNPTMVSFSDHRSMGEDASSIAISNFKNTLTSMKRLVGLPFASPRARSEMARHPGLTFLPDDAGGVACRVRLADEEITVPVECAAGMVVGHMGRVAGAGGAAPQDWVVAVPPYYTDAQRRMFLRGCGVAGITVQRLLHESTASALAYGIFKDVKKEFVADKPSNVLFIDLGESAYTASVVAFEPGKLTVKSCHWDMDLGGRDFDHIIGNWAGAEFVAKNKGVMNPMEHPKARLKLLKAAEKLKKTLSPAGVKEGRISLECLLEDCDFFGKLTTQTYETMCAPLLDRLVAPVERALAEVRLTAADLSAVEIVGGGSRVACVKRRLSALLGLDGNAINFGLSTTLNADESVARGAALMSAILSPRFKVLPYEIVEAQPHPIRIAWDGPPGEPEGGDSVVMFERGGTFPCVRRVTLRRAGEFAVRAGYDAGAEYLPVGTAQEICGFVVKAPAGETAKVRVNVKMDIHGVVTLSSTQMVEEVEEMEVEAKEGEEKEKDKKEEGVEAEAKKKKVRKTNLDFTVTRPLDWSTTRTNALVEREVSMANADRIVRETADARNALESYVYDMRDKLSTSLAPYSTSEERSVLNQDLVDAENWLYDEFDAKKSCFVHRLKELRVKGDPIAYRESETHARPRAMAHLKRLVDTYQAFLTSNDEKYAHITVEEKQKCRTKLEEVSTWMYTALDQQADLAPHVTPTIGSVDVMAKGRELGAVVDPVRNKRAPPPPKKEVKKEVPKEEEKGAEPMEVDEPVQPPPEVEIDSEEKNVE